MTAPRRARDPGARPGFARLVARLALTATPGIATNAVGAKPHCAIGADAARLALLLLACASRVASTCTVAAIGVVRVLDGDAGSPGARAGLTSPARRGATAEVVHARAVALRCIAAGASVGLLRHAHAPATVAARGARLTCRAAARARRPRTGVGRAIDRLRRRARPFTVAAGRQRRHAGRTGRRSAWCARPGRSARCSVRPVAGSAAGRSGARTRGMARARCAGDRGASSLAARFAARFTSAAARSVATEPIGAEAASALARRRARLPGLQLAHPRRVTALRPAAAVGVFRVVHRHACPATSRAGLAGSA